MIFMYTLFKNTIQTNFNYIRNIFMKNIFLFSSKDSDEFFIFWLVLLKSPITLIYRSFTDFFPHNFNNFSIYNKEMGCCCSKRLDSTSEKSQADKTAESLKSELDKKAFATQTPRERHKKKHSPRLLVQRSEDWSSTSTSPKDNYRSSSLMVDTIKVTDPSPRSSRSPQSARSPRSPRFDIDFSKKFLKIPVEERYTPIKILHSAFHGDTLIANDNRTSLKKVIKEVKKSAIQKKDKEKLIMEIQKFHCLDHPNIVKLHEVYESEEKWSLIYEFFSGSNLLELTHKESVDNSLASSITRDILSGLNYCHRNRVIHLGLNLEKIILDSRDGKINCKITRFSYPWELEGLVEIDEVTCFMAPEILNKVFDNPASDIWSAGVILYLMIQEKPPFRGKTVKDLLKDYERVLNFDETNWVFESAELKDLLSKMLEFDCNKRITVEEALNHPWVKNYHSLPSSPTNNRAINRLVEFTSKDVITQELLKYFKVTLADQNESRQFIELFKSLDTNKDGQITKEELLNETKNLDIEVQNKLKMILKNADLMKKGYIGFSEFATACTDWNTQENIKKFEKAFKICDKNGDGQLSLKELKEKIEGIRTKEWVQFFGNVDSDQSGTISLEELKAFLFGGNVININRV
ncbi:unnamed protein product [Blepharisma stoltei]|uniref:Calcium-dependent protein kinase n=1 Tax=Blepharisma stoltei TaxID=1481888 RepID=A0AAU9J4Z2_9CILI|nr:unnamed protein product [Blepharisma stoltei]